MLFEVYLSNCCRLEVAGSSLYAPPSVHSVLVLYLLESHGQGGIQIFRKMDHNNWATAPEPAWQFSLGCWSSAFPPNIQEVTVPLFLWKVPMFSLTVIQRFTNRNTPRNSFSVMWRVWLRVVISPVNARLLSSVSHHHAETVEGGDSNTYFSSQT